MSYLWFWDPQPGISYPYSLSVVDRTRESKYECKGQHEDNPLVVSAFYWLFHKIP